jgi:hypothetical protein
MNSIINTIINWFNFYTKNTEQQNEKIPLPEPNLKLSNKEIMIESKKDMNIPYINFNV